MERTRAREPSDPWMERGDALPESVFDARASAPVAGPLRPRERSGGAIAMRTAAIRVKRRYAATPQRVFDAWLDPAIAGRWLFATASQPLLRAAIDPHVGGECRFVEQRPGRAVPYVGRYVELIPGERLAFTLATDAPAQMLGCVHVALAPARRGCALTLTHEGLARHDAAPMRERWMGMLYGLGVTLAA